VGLAIGGIGVALAIMYELAVPMREFSTFRLLLGQGVVVAAIGFAVGSTFTGATPRVFFWVWATLTVAYQGMRLWRERGETPARIAWVGLALTTVVLVEREHVAWFAVLCALAFIAGGVHLAATLFRSGALTELAVLMFASLLALLAISKARTDLSFLVTSLVAGGGMVMASARVPVNTPLPWWKGFIRESHAEHIGAAARKVVKRVSELAWFKIAFGYIAVLVLWVRFSHGRRLGELRPVVNLVGHTFLGIVVAGRITELAPSQPDVSAILSGALTSAYGVALVVNGAIKDRFFTRCLGSALALAPALFHLIFSKAIPTEQFAWLLTTTGLSLSAVGLLTKRVLDKRDSKNERLAESTGIAS